MNILVKVNLANVEAVSFDAVPPGTYRVSVERCEVTQSAAGNDGIFWLYRINDVISTRGSEDGTGIIGRTLVNNTMLMESSLPFLTRTLLALGTAPEDLQDEFDVDQEWCDSHVGKECVVTTRIRPYNGEPQADIQNMRALSESEAGQLV